MISIVPILITPLLLLGNGEEVVKQAPNIQTPMYEYYTRRMPTLNEVQEELSYRQYLEELEQQIQRDLRLIEEKKQEELRREQEELRQAQEKERKEKMVRTYYTSSDVSQPSLLTAEELNIAIEGTGLQGLGQYFYEAEQAYGVNSVFLLSIAILESGWGESPLAQTKNNLFGYQAYDNDPNKAMYFSSKAEAIHTVGSHLAKNYLRSDGKYYNGATPAGVNVMYCSGGEWATKVVSIMNKVMDSVPY